MYFWQILSLCCRNIADFRAFPCRGGHNNTCTFQYFDLFQMFNKLLLTILTVNRKVAQFPYLNDFHGDKGSYIHKIDGPTDITWPCNWYVLGSLTLTWICFGSAIQRWRRHQILWSRCLSVCCGKNYNLGNNFLTVRDREFIFGIYILNLMKI